MLRGGEGAAWCKLGEHQFMAIFEVEKLQPDRMKHFGLMVRDEKQIKAVRKKLLNKYKLKLVPGFRCDFRDPWGNRFQLVDYREIQFTKTPRILEGMGLDGLGKTEHALQELRAELPAERGAHYALRAQLSGGSLRIDRQRVLLPRQRFGTEDSTGVLSGSIVKRS